jgi:hypothetical protein
MRKYGNVILALIIMAAAAGGCATAVKKADVAQDTKAADEQKTEKYAVQKGDSLWEIAGKSGIYGDAFQWPLLYKSNRDQIEDPDLIGQDQEIDVKKDFTDADIQDAMQKAKDTPAYIKHSAPRKQLPLKY